MNKILYVVLFLSLAPIPHAFGMNAPTVTDADDDDFVDRGDGGLVPGTADKAQQPTTGVTHVASIANNQGQVLHFGVNGNSIADTITGIGEKFAKTAPVVTQAMTQLTQKIDQTAQVTGAAFEIVGKQGAGAIATMGTAGAHAVGNMVSAATSQIGNLAYIAGDAAAQCINSINDQGRANIAELSTAWQNSSNNTAASTQKTIQLAGTQASRALGQARNVVNSTKAVVTEFGTQVNQLAATAMTPENVKAFGDSESAQQFVTHAGNSMNKLSGAATSVATHTNQLLVQSKKVVQNAQPIVSNMVETTKNLADATKHLATLIGNAVQVNSTCATLIGVNAPTPALPSSRYQQGATIEEIPDAPLALPAPEQFATLSINQRTRSQKDLFSAVKSMINRSTVQVSQAFVTHAQQSLSKALDGQAMTPEEYKILFNINQKAQQANNTGQLLLEWPAHAASDAGQPAAPASQPTSPTHATPSELANFKRLLEQSEQQRRQEQQAHTHSQSRLQKLTAVLPQPALVVIASVCVTGLLVTAKKLHTKWKKKQQKKEKNKTKQSEKQDTSAQQ